MIVLVVLISLFALTSALYNDTGAENQNWAVNLFGNSLYQWQDSDRSRFAEKPTIDLLKDKDVVAIYFSASWCAPCRQFTPILEQFYNDMNKKLRGRFEIVLLSRDSSAEEFVSYYQKMPWLAVPFTDGRLEKCLDIAAKAYQLKGM